MAISLRHEKEYYGVFWIGYKNPHQFSDEEIRYISTLAGQVTLSASNAKLFQTSEIGRQRLEAKLAHKPRVLVAIRGERLPPVPHVPVMRVALDLPIRVLERRII